MKSLIEKEFWLPIVVEEGDISYKVSADCYFYYNREDDIIESEEESFTVHDMQHNEITSKISEFDKRHMMEELEWKANDFLDEIKEIKTSDDYYDEHVDRILTE